MRGKMASDCDNEINEAEYFDVETLGTGCRIRRETVHAAVEHSRANLVFSDSLLLLPQTDCGPLREIQVRTRQPPELQPNRHLQHASAFHKDFGIRDSQLRDLKKRSQAINPRQYSSTMTVRLRGRAALRRSIPGQQIDDDVSQQEQATCWDYQGSIVDWSLAPRGCGGK